jgi:hypothetical protein
MGPATVRDRGRDDSRRAGDATDYAMPGTPEVVDRALRARLDALMDEGWEIWDRFDRTVRQQRWHSFIAADYERVLGALVGFRTAEGSGRFLEWGSANGVVAIMADMLGFDACGIELDPSLVEVASALAERHGSAARFVTGSFVPAGYRYVEPGIGNENAIGTGPSAYQALGRPLEDFDLVYAYPWAAADEAVMVDLMRCYGGANARLLIAHESGVRVYRGGRLA